MSTKSRQTIYGGRIMGAEIRAQGAREAAKRANRDADRAEAEAWSIRMEGYGGPAQPSPTIGNVSTAGLAGSKLSAIAARPERACLWTLSAGRETHRYGSLRPRFWDGQPE
jgi:hypothetical protein